MTLHLDLLNSELGNWVVSEMKNCTSTCFDKDKIIIAHAFRFNLITSSTMNDWFNKLTWLIDARITLLCINYKIDTNEWIYKLQTEKLSHLQRIFTVSSIRSFKVSNQLKFIHTLSYMYNCLKCLIMFSIYQLLKEICYCFIFLILKLLYCYSTI